MSAFPVTVRDIIIHYKVFSVTWQVVASREKKDGLGNHYL